MAASDNTKSQVKGSTADTPVVSGRQRGVWGSSSGGTKEITLSGMNVIGRQTCHQHTDLQPALDYLAKAAEETENEAGNFTPEGVWRGDWTEFEICGQRPLNRQSFQRDAFLAVPPFLLSSLTSRIPRMEPLFGPVGS